jgi:predicted DNA-binding protein with PD1-like motif
MGKVYSYKQFDNTFVVSIATKEEIVSAINQFCNDVHVSAGEISGIGAINEVTLRMFNPDAKKYVDKTFHEQMEISNLIGNISTMDGKIYLHLHITLGRCDYSAIAGHLLSARINGACELVIRRFNGDLSRVRDAELGLNIYDI